MNIETIKKIQSIKLKAFMFDVKGLDIRLTKEEQNLLASGKNTLEDMDRETLLKVIGVQDHIRVSNEVKSCCLLSLYSGFTSASIDNNYKAKRYDMSDVIDCIISAHYSYLQLLKRIRKKIITVDEPVAYNDKI